MADMAQWGDRPIAALDTETTGTDPASDRCVEVALLLVGPGGEPTPGGYETLVDCGLAIPDAAVAIHGITGARAAADGVSSRECLIAVVELLERLAGAQVPVVVFNARFDWPLLAAEAARVGLALPEVCLIDPLVIDRHLDRYRRGKRRLSDLAGHYGVPLEVAHRARDDALASARLAQAVARRYPEEVGARSPDELHQRQVAWFAAWRDDFNAWLGRCGRPALPTGTWPGRVATEHEPEEAAGHGQRGA